VEQIAPSKMMIPEMIAVAETPKNYVATK